MSIPATCPKCHFTVSAPKEYLGRKAKCAKCREVFVVGETPKPETPSEPAKVVKKIPNPLMSHGPVILCPTLQTKEQQQKFRAMILGPLQEPVAMEPVSTGYKLALGLLAVVLILLFCVYLGMIAGFCYLEYFYFTEGFGNMMEQMKDTEGKGVVGMFVAMLAIPVGILIVIIILVKPLFFGWKREETRFEIQREQEPLFFEFVDQLCHFVSAPAPERIFVDCDVNASASLSQGFFGAVFGGNQCDLTIGLPLVAGMKTSEVAGILAHEFGHFTQSGAKRVKYIVYVILSCFAHIYYYRDRMDQWLAAGARTPIHYIQIFFIAILALSWLVRRLSWCFMFLGNFVAGFMSRQMEFDADGFQIKLVGSQRFAETHRKILMLNFANQKTISDINYMIQEDRLPDNYPLLIAANMKILEDEFTPVVTKIINESKTAIFDTHPCDKDRIAAAEKAEEPGLFHCEHPASLLFRNFLDLSRRVSLDFYKKVVGLTWNPDVLKGAKEIIGHLSKEGESQKALRQFFLKSFVRSRFLPLEHAVSSKNVPEAVQRLRKAREEQLQLAEKISTATESFAENEGKCRQAEYFRELIRAGFPLKSKEISPEFRFQSLEQANQKVQSFELELAKLHLQLGKRDNLAAQRLACVRELLSRKEIQNKIEQGEDLFRRLETLYPILVLIGSLQSEINTLLKRYGIVGGLITVHPHLDGKQVAPLGHRIEAEMAYFKNTLWQLKQKFTKFPYPFEGTQIKNLGDFFVPYECEKDLEQESYGATEMLLGRLITTNTLILGEVCAIALASEAAVGLSPLPLPATEK